MLQSYISFELEPTNSACPLEVTVKLDDTVVWSTPGLAQCEKLKVAVDDNVDADHCLRIILQNKTADHTVIDAEGKIVSDSMVVLKNIYFDEIDFMTKLQKIATYSHDYNGTGHAVTEPFFGTLGCNGTVEVKFSSPIYLWLLDNM